MTRLPVLSGRDILRVLEGLGFRRVAQRESHIRLKGERDGQTRIVIVPNHPEIATGTLLSILRQAGVTREDPLRLLGW